jgi:hypothetical protein
MKYALVGGERREAQPVGATRSKHSKAALLIRRGIYDNLQSFSELEQRISALGDETTKICRRRI